MSNLQGSQEQYVDHCNIPLPAKQKYASFDAPVRPIKISGLLFIKRDI